MDAAQLERDGGPLVVRRVPALRPALGDRQHGRRQRPGTHDRAAGDDPRRRGGQPRAASLNKCRRCAHGADHALRSDEADFASRLAPSTIIVCAALAGEPSRFGSRTLIGEEKTIVGSCLGHRAARKGLFWTLKDVRTVLRLANCELQTTVARRLSLSAAQEAVDAHRGHMTAGKVLLVGDPHSAPLD